MTKTFKRVGAVATVAGVLAGAGLMPLSVWADDNTTTLTFNFTVAAGDTAILSLAASNDGSPLEVGETGSRLIRVLQDSEYNASIDALDGTQNHYSSEDVVVNCTSSTACTMTISHVSTSGGVKFSTPGDSNISVWYTDGSYYASSATLLTENTDFEVRYEAPEERFEGQAYVAWDCGDGSVCLSLIENIDNDGQGDHGPIDYRPASGVVDERTGNSFDAFDIDLKKGFILPGRLGEWRGEYIDKTDVTNETFSWADVDISLLIDGTDMMPIEDAAERDGVCDRWAVSDRSQFEACVDHYAEQNGIPVIRSAAIQSFVASGKGAYVNNCEYACLVAIYDEENYAAVESAGTDTMTFVPFNFGVRPVDVTDTSVSDPAILEMPLQETRVVLRAMDVNDFEIESIRALYVPEGAVTIEQAEDGSFVIEFNSNFYDDVLFEIESTTGRFYTLQIVRQTLSEVRWEHASQWNNNFEGIRAEFTFADYTTYEDYELTATLIYGDGTEDVQEMTNLGWIDENYGGNLIYTREYDGAQSGKGLKRANYGIALTTEEMWDIKGVYINVRYSGGDEEVYAGTFAGSGKGYYIENHEYRGERE